MLRDLKILNKNIFAEFTWPSKQCGTHAVIGVATAQAPLHSPGNISICLQFIQTETWTPITILSVLHQNQNAHFAGYQSLVGTTSDSWGWDLGRCKVGDLRISINQACRVYNIHFRHHRVHDSFICMNEFQAYHDSAKLAGTPYPTSSLPTVDDDHDFGDNGETIDDKFNDLN